MDAGFRDFAVELAREATKIIATNFGRSSTTWKDDGTPLTVTDLAVNQLVVESIKETYPDHALIGEEQSLGLPEEAEWVWVCDPLDGTIPFSHGLPLCTFSLALTQDGNAELGVVADPFSDRLFVAQRGSGATVNGEPISVSTLKELDSSVIDLSSRIDDAASGVTIRRSLTEGGAIITGLYSCVYASMLVASGHLAAAINVYPHPWDVAAVSVIVTEAGGRVTDIVGRGQRYDRPINGFIASNGHVHDQMVNAARGEQEPLSRVATDEISAAIN